MTGLPAPGSVRLISFTSQCPVNCKRGESVMNEFSFVRERVPLKRGCKRKCDVMDSVSRAET